MRILFLNQTFFPDVASSGQHLSDLAVQLAERSHRVTVVTGRRAYDDPRVRFPKRETWHGVEIHRVASAGFGKAARWRRTADFASFLALATLRLARLPRQDVVVALTSPPLISVLGAGLTRLWRSRFIYWVMDLNPDAALAAGWLRADSAAARALDQMSRFSFQQAERVIALDRFMRDRIVAKGIAAEKVAVLPPWSHDGAVGFDAEGRKRFRAAHGLDGKFVVMYAGNHSPCHPLDTLLEAARRLAAHRDVVFCFIGGGSEWRKIQERATRPASRPPQPGNLLCLPYEPLERLAGSLSAADLHAVVMGDAFVGIVHPCKIYNLLKVGQPILCVGPKPCHLADLFVEAADHLACGWAGHGEVDRVVRHILRVRDWGADGTRRAFEPLAQRFSKQALLPRLVAALEGTDGAPETARTSLQERESLRRGDRCVSSVEEPGREH